MKHLTANELYEVYVAAIESGLFVALRDERGNVRLAPVSWAEEHPELERVTLDELKRLTVTEPNMSKWN